MKIGILFIIAAALLACNRLSNDEVYVPEPELYEVMFANAKGAYSRGQLDSALEWGNQAYRLAEADSNFRVSGEISTFTFKVMQEKAIAIGLSPNPNNKP